MNRLRRLGVVAIATLVLLTTGTGGVATISGDRSVELAVADQGEAYVGAEPAEPTVGAGPPEDVVVLTLTNRFEQPLTVDVTVQGDGPTPPVLQGYDAPDHLGTGEAAAVTATVNCDASPGTDTETWTVDVSATGDDVSVDTTRTVTVACTGGGE
jgi:hypothetical protein